MPLEVDSLNVEIALYGIIAEVVVADTPRLPRTVIINDNSVAVDVYDVSKSFFTLLPLCVDKLTRTED